MGLYASFTPEQLGYPITLEQELLGEIAVVEIDYSAACEAFVETFLASAIELVPVDTGYLQSTIDANTDGFFCECMAEAEYAQYVEYGTWKMDAQPYFTPALEEGLQAFQELAGEALDEAQEEMEEICQSIMESVASSFGGEGFLGELGGILMGGLMLWLMFPILVNIYAILDSLNPNSKFGSEGAGRGSVDVIIT